jgi:hypothetical protein
MFPEADWDAPIGEQPIELEDYRGGEPSEWPADLGVREWPVRLQPIAQRA